MDEKLASGEMVISDRYYFSGVAYTAAKGVDIEWCRSADRGITEPDLVVFVDVGPSEVAKRPGFGNEKYEKIEYLERVYAVLRDEVERCGRGVVVDGTQKIERIVEEIERIIVELE